MEKINKEKHSITEREEKIQEYITEISNILQNEKNEEIENQKDAISNFLIDLATIKKEPDRLTTNIESIRKDIENLKKTPFYKKHKKIINQAIKLFPELADLAKTKDPNKRTYYDLLDELQEALIEDDQERVNELMGSITITEWAAIHEDDSTVFDIIENQLNHIQTNIQENNITNKYLGKMLSIMKRSLEKCRNIVDKKEDQKETWKIISIAGCATLAALLILISTLTKTTIREQGEELEKTKKELQMKEIEMKNLNYKIHLLDSLNAKQYQRNNGINLEPTE